MEGITIALSHDRRVVEVGPGTSAVLRVKIANIGPQRRELTLRVEGMPPALCSFRPAGAVTVDPGGAPLARDVIIECAETVPAAGHRDVLIVATDARSARSGALRWRSDRKRLHVLSQSKLALKVVSPAERVGDPGAGHDISRDTYRATVQVTNRGNTRLEGTVRPPDTASLAAHHPPGDGARLVDGSWVRCAGRFALDPGASADLAVEVDLPTQGWRSRSWEVPVLPVVTGRSDNVIRVTDGPLRVRQRGRLADLLAAPAQAAPALGAGVRRFGEWSARPMQTRRGALAAVPVAVVAALAAGLGLGSAVAGGSDPDPSASDVAGANGTAANAGSSLGMDECVQMLTWRSDGYVRWVQRVLDRTWLASHPQSNPRPLKEDGELGPRTTAVLMDFQRGHGLAPTGQLDAATREQLLAAAKEAGPRQAPPTPSGRPVAGAVPADLCQDVLD
jgi:peptidoglycan hydrolase-like protein with peptidoglycan-binding domain